MTKILPYFCFTRALFREPLSPKSIKALLKSYPKIEHARMPYRWLPENARYMLDVVSVRVTYRLDTLRARMRGRAGRL